MIDLDIYRQRIGTFRSKLTSNKCQDVKVSRHLSREHRFCVKTMFILGTVALCLVLLGCQLEEQEVVGWLSIPGTTCHKILRFVRSVWELRGNIPDNAKTIGNNFQWFSSILTKEPKYQIHADNTSYRSEPVDGSFIVERRRTSYLLGNAGQHAYNGNPPKRSNTSPHDTAAKIKELHFNMVLRLNDQLHPNIATEWEKVRGMLEMYLPPADIAGVKNMFDVCGKLLTLDIIRHGQYENLKKLFPGHEICCDIVDSCSGEIEELQQGEETDSAMATGGEDDIVANQDGETDSTAAAAMATGVNVNINARGDVTVGDIGGRNVINNPGSSKEPIGNQQQ